MSEAILDELACPGQMGRTRVGGITFDSPRILNLLAAVTALSPAPDGFTVADVADKVHTITGRTDREYSVRQAATDLRKLRAHNLID